MNYITLFLTSSAVIVGSSLISQPPAKAVEVSTAQQLKGAIIAEEILGKLESIERQIKSLEAKVDKLVSSPGALQSLSAPVKKEAPTAAATPSQSKDELNMQLQKLKAFTEAEGIKPNKEMIEKLMEDKTKQP